MTCKPVKKRQKCTTKTVTGTFKYVATGTAKLTRGSVVCATGSITTRKQYVLTPRRTLSRGTYTLTVRDGAKVRRLRITI